MRVLHLDSGLEMRGGQFQALRLAEVLARAGHTILFLSPEGSPCFEAGRKIGLDVKPLTMFGVRRFSRQFDFCHAHDARSHTLAALFSRAPVIVSRRVGFPIRGGFSRWKYARPKRFIAVSNHVRLILLAAGVSPERIFVVYDGVPLLAPSIGSQRVVIPDSADPEKGTALALEGARLAGVRAHLSTDLETDLKDAGMFVYITRSEGLGSGALLAMSAGVPVVASRVGGLPEIVKDGETGLVDRQHAAGDSGGDPTRKPGLRILPAFGGAGASGSRGAIYDSHYGRGDDQGLRVMLEACLAGLFGLLIGSFLNVCIFRLPRDLSVVTPRSFCPECEKMIAWYDNVPLFSFVRLKGRCRHCGARIPWRYPIVEALTALLFFLFVGPLGLTLAAFKFCLFAALLVGMIFSDFEERILPDEFTLGGAVVGAVLSWWIPVEDGAVGLLLMIAGIEVTGRWLSVAESVVGALLPSGFLWVTGEIFFRLRHKEGLGLGDVKMMMTIGAFLGLRGSLLTLIVGTLLGSVLGLIFILATKKDHSSYELPLGTFLGVAALGVSLTSVHLFTWLASAF